MNDYLVYACLSLLALIFILGFALYAPIFFRRSSLLKISKEYSLDFSEGDISIFNSLGRGLGARRGHFITGKIGETEICFYDIKIVYSSQRLISEKIDALDASETTKDIYKGILGAQRASDAAYRISVNPTRGGSISRVQTELISFFSLNGKAKLVGQSLGTMNIADKSNVYIPAKNIRIILEEIRKSGVSALFDSYQKGQSGKFYLLKMPYVREPSEEDVSFCKASSARDASL